MNAQYSLKIGGGGMQTLSTAAVQLTTTATPCQMVVILGVSTNTAHAVVCNSTAATATTGRIGIPVYAGSTAIPVTVYCTDVSQVYVDGVSTEAVSYIYYAIGVPS